MDLENMTLSKGSQIQKGVYYMIPFIWTLEKARP